MNFIDLAILFIGNCMTSVKCPIKMKLIASVYMAPSVQNQIV